MASIFTYDPDPPRVSSPWSVSESSTPQVAAAGNKGMGSRSRSNIYWDNAGPDCLSDYGITKLEPEPQEGPTEYKLHLLLRPRRQFAFMSTGDVVGGSCHSRTNLSACSPSPSIYETSPRSHPPKSPQEPRSTHGRQQRLQQLTTQLLWRLQQSSPFHSSTAANPALPILPDETSKLGLPQKPARLLPGLEESQGALYEIGVADDGAFVGLTQDELEESLINLQSMAASLGCKVQVLRRVVVGKCDWAEGEQPVVQSHSENLIVAEALVSPDLEFYKLPTSHEDGSSGEAPDELSAGVTKKMVLGGDSSNTEQIRVSITGPSTAGKSSLLGCLTTSLLDNGRGKSRLSLLKHRHEISSGITSSVAQELLGYAGASQSDSVGVINYASGNVAAWDDIHAATGGGRLAFVSDLPGLVRYSKSTLRGLISWAPHYVILCIPADSGEENAQETDKSGPEQISEIDLCLSYLDLCTKLQVPTLMVITKMDVASRAGLRNTLGRVLSALKTTGRKPVMLPVAGKDNDLQQVRTVDGEEVKRTIAAVESWLTTVPIVLTSAVDGCGIGKLHAFLRYLPVPSRPPARTISLTKPGLPNNSPSDVFDIDEVFAIPPSKVYSISAQEGSEENRGMVLCGLVRYGTVSVGDELVVGPLLVDQQSAQRSLQSTRKVRSDQYSPQSFRSRLPLRESSSSYFQSHVSSRLPMPVQARWKRVRVVSVRNIRMPVRSLLQDQVGTVGVEPIPSLEEDDVFPCLSRTRKGMVLANFHNSRTSIPNPLSYQTGFVATFPSREFSSPTSPPLLLGGNAIVYIASIRATVKVICVNLSEDEVISSPPSPTEPEELFSFDNDLFDHREQRKDVIDNGGNGAHRELDQVIINSSTNRDHNDVRITFSFISSVEWVEIGSQVLLMPGPSSMALSDDGGSTALSGLEGFVGTVSDVLNGDVSEL